MDIIYVNGSNRDDTEPGRLIHDRNCREAKDMYSEVLAARVYMLKETGEGIEIMCKELQELYELYDEGVKGQVCDMNSIFHRISIRKYESREVEQDKIELMLHAAMAAPSACNQQPWEFYVVTDKEVISRLSEASPYTKCAKGAPLVFVPCFRTEGVAPDHLQAFALVPRDYPTEERAQQERYDESRIYYVK